MNLRGYNGLWGGVGRGRDDEMRMIGFALAFLDRQSFSFGSAWFATLFSGLVCLAAHDGLDLVDTRGVMGSRYVSFVPSLIFYDLHHCCVRFELDSNRSPLILH